MDVSGVALTCAESSAGEGGVVEALPNWGRGVGFTFRVAHYGLEGFRL